MYYFTFRKEIIFYKLDWKIRPDICVFIKFEDRILDKEESNNIDDLIESAEFEELKNIDTLIDGDYSVKSLSKDIFGKSILELSKTLQSDIINNKQVGSLDPGTIHRTLANVKEDLMKQNKLEERCDG